MNKNVNNRYGSLDYLSRMTADKIESIISILDELGVYYDIYYGYPIIDEFEKKNM